MMRTPILLLVSIFVSVSVILTAQNVPILSYDTNTFGQVELEIEGSADQYYVLTARHEPNGYETMTSITMGVDGPMIISEPLEAYPLESYKITAYDKNDPADLDNDGIDDITEYNGMPLLSPLNHAVEVPPIDGSVSINSEEFYSELSNVYENIPWAPFLDNQEFLKWAIYDFDTENPRVYFINSNTHYIHADFYSTLNDFSETMSGEVIYNPNIFLPNGVVGNYMFNYSFGEAFDFETTQRTMELLAANMPFLRNNLSHFIGGFGEAEHTNFYADEFAGSRIDVILESEFFSEVDYIPLNQAEGYGLFRLMDLEETPGSRDVVLYESLPNSLPRVGGIMTSVVQTPLSHVNLRAIQDNLPNAYIKNPLAIDSIANLIGKYVYYKVAAEGYEIREATLDEVNEWFESIRPTEEQVPVRDLSQTDILPLDEITFDMSTAFGAKCANVATMRTFGFPEGTIPNGFGIPFYFYDEFMKHNGFYEKAAEMINDPTFITDLATRVERLDEFRDDIRDGSMPQWMLVELQEMHDTWPEGTSIRTRSSTNNEDLPGFSGAGLYTSKTQHPWEGHIQKSIKQVYASMWNFRAYEERDFYRVDHFQAAMGILCHPNYQEEKSNGVGISLDPLYNTPEAYYLNTQVGEFLITNPDANTVPEEILLYKDPEVGYAVLRNSNLVEDGELVMDDVYIDQLRDYLTVIHDEFAVLYDVVGAPGFGMDIEYKVTAEDQLIIKQARPWVSFWANINAEFDIGAIQLIEPENSSELTNEEVVTVEVMNEGLRELQGFDVTLVVDEVDIETITVETPLPPQTPMNIAFATALDFSEIRDYTVTTIVSHPADGYSNNDTLNTIVSKLYELEGAISVKSARDLCGSAIRVTARVENNGDNTFTNTEIEVSLNGVVIDTIEYDFSIPYQSYADITFEINENLDPVENTVGLRLISMNGMQDAIPTDNVADRVIPVDPDLGYVRLVINADNYPAETSWLVRDNNNEIIASGALVFGQDVEDVEICVNYNECYTLHVLDSYGDGICCFFGNGDFSLYHEDGTELIYNDGEFGDEAVEPFCLSDCELDFSYETVNASTNLSADGSITILAENGVEPYEYSIDGGTSFVSTNVFTDLEAGIYDVIVRDASEANCSIEKVVDLGYEVNVNVDDLALSEIKVFPNPTRDLITLRRSGDAFTDGPSVIKVYDPLGNTVYVQALESGALRGAGVVLSLASYPSGAYIIRYITRDAERSFTVFKI